MGGTEKLVYGSGKTGWHECNMEKIVYHVDSWSDEYLESPAFECEHS